MLTKKLKITLLLLLMIVVMGTIGLHFIEGWSFEESLYTTIITLTTVGYGDFVPKTLSGRFFTIALVVTGVGVTLFGLGQISEAFLEARIKKIFGRGKMEKTISKMSNHYIICGCGRIGMLICKELFREGVPFVVIDSDHEVIEKMEENKFVYYRGDATHDKSLIAAGIKKAKGVVCVLPTDAENLYVILTAKELNNSIFILSRSEEEVSEHRLLRAGADKVMSPYTLGGMRMSMALLRPAMLDFIEITTTRQSLELSMEEIAICETSLMIGMTLEQSEIRQRFGLIVVAIKKETGKMIFNPLSTYIIENGDRFIALGEMENLQRFSNNCVG
ncbi:MAG: potassium channel protein [Deltaproteobacteria bacterium]